jgi:hypothetical protein
MLDTDRRNSGIVHRATVDLSSGQETGEFRPVVLEFADEPQRGRLHPGLDLVQRVYSLPRNYPRLTAFRKPA